MQVNQVTMSSSVLIITIIGLYGNDTLTRRTCCSRTHHRFTKHLMERTDHTQIDNII